MNAKLAELARTANLLQRLYSQTTMAAVIEFYERRAARLAREIDG